MTRALVEATHRSGPIVFMSLALSSMAMMSASVVSSASVTHVASNDAQARSRVLNSASLAGDLASLAGADNHGIWSLGSGRKIGEARSISELSSRGKVAYSRVIGSLESIEVSNFDGSGRIVLGRGISRVTEIEWSRDGTVVYWVHENRLLDRWTDISWFNLVTRKRRTYRSQGKFAPRPPFVINPTPFSAIAASPSGREVVAIGTMYQRSNPVAALAVLRLDRPGSFRTLLKMTPNKDWLSPIAWTERGIIVHRKYNCTQSGLECRNDVLLVSPTSGKVISRLRGAPARSIFVTGTDSGRWIAAYAIEGGTPVSYVGRADGGQLTRLPRGLTQIEEIG